MNLRLAASLCRVTCCGKAGGGAGIACQGCAARSRSSVAGRAAEKMLALQENFFLTQRRRMLCLNCFIGRTAGFSEHWR